MMGSDDYSHQALNFTSRASQTMHIVTHTEINSMKIDLQNADHFEGYSIESELDVYKCKIIHKMNNTYNEDKVIVA